MEILTPISHFLKWQLSDGSSLSRMPGVVLLSQKCCFLTEHETQPGKRIQVSVIPSLTLTKEIPPVSPAAPREEHAEKCAQMGRCIIYYIYTIQVLKTTNQNPRIFSIRSFQCGFGLLFLRIEVCSFLQVSTGKKDTYLYTSALYKAVISSHSAQ